jgi:hypothetical protein
VLGYEVEESEPDRAVYCLDHLLLGELVFPTDPEDQIAAVRLVQVRIAPRYPNGTLEHLKLKFSKQASLSQVTASIGYGLRLLGASPGQATVRKATFQLEFLTDGTKKAQTMTFHVSCPNSCDLKSKPDAMRVIGERCLKLFGIARE